MNLTPLPPDQITVEAPRDGHVIVGAHVNERGYIHFVKVPLAAIAKYSDGKGNYLPDREAIQDAILERLYFNPEQIAAATPAPGVAPTLTLLGGRGGAGKSWFSTSPDSPMTPGSIVINSDDIKELLPEYNGWNSGYLHEESSDIASRAMEIAMLSGLNVAYDATMRSPGTFHRMIPTFQAYGYKVNSFFMHTAPHISAYRVLGRWLNGGGIAGKARYVSPTYSLNSNTNEATFDNVKPMVDKWAIYNNNGTKGPVYVSGNIR